MQLINECKCPCVIEMQGEDRFLLIQEIFSLENGWVFNRDESCFAPCMDMQIAGLDKTHIHWQNHAIAKREQMDLRVHHVPYQPTNLPPKQSFKKRVKSLFLAADEIPETLSWHVPTVSSGDMLHLNNAQEETITLPDAAFVVSTLGDHARYVSENSIACVDIHLAEKHLCVVRAFKINSAEAIQISFASPGVVT